MRLTRIPNLVFAGALLWSAAGCQTDKPVYGTDSPPPKQEDGGFTPDHIRVRVESDPLGAIVRVNNIRRGTTPLVLTLESGGDGSIDFNTDISADFSTNPRAVAGLGLVTAHFASGDFLPSRITFIGTDIRTSGRALTVQ